MKHIEKFNESFINRFILDKKIKLFNYNQSQYYAPN